MLAFFPPLRPDELLPYGSMARYNAYLQFLRPADLVQAFFGANSVRPTLPYSNGMAALLRQLPPGAPFTAEQLVRDHTLYPWLSAFLPLAEREAMLTAFCALPQQPTGQMKRVSPRRGPQLPWLRFCPECADEDKRQYGEIHWRRLFQVPGVNVCPEHDLFLEESPVPYPRRAGNNAYCLLDPAALQLPPRPLNRRRQSDALLRQIAEDTRRLLSGPPLRPSQGSMSRQYGYRAEQVGIRTHKAKNLANRVSSLVQSRYPPDLLRHLNSSGVDLNKLTWAYRAMNYADQREHPLHHILLIRALGFSVEQFMTDAPAAPIPHSGPYPCLNPFCRHYRQPCIVGYQIVGTSSTYQLPLVEFRCDCGFAYTHRMGKWAIDLHQWDYISDYGPVWYQGFRQLWQNDDLSLADIAARLRLSVPDVIQAASRLSLSKIGRLQQIQ